jgi:hypothetical protein
VGEARISIKTELVDDRASDGARTHDARGALDERRSIGCGDVLRLGSRAGGLLTAKIESNDRLARITRRNQNQRNPGDDQRHAKRSEHRPLLAPKRGERVLHERLTAGVRILFGGKDLPAVLTWVIACFVRCDVQAPSTPQSE